MNNLEQPLSAIEEDRIDDLVAMLERNPDLAESRTEQGISLLRHALYLGKIEAVEALLEADPTLDVFDAAALGGVEVMRELLDEDVSRLEAVSADGFRPLHLAAYFGNFQTTAFILECGADSSSVVEGPLQLQPLHSAVAGGHDEIAWLLIDSDADVNAKQQGGFTPLMGAAAGGHAEIIDYLLHVGADITIEAGGKTAADIAVEHGHPDLAERLRG